MDVSVSLQLLTIGVSVAVGFALGVSRMLLGIIMSVFGRSKISAAICDIVCFIFAAFVTYCLFLIFTYGNVRGYVLFFEFIGLLLYCLTIGRAKTKAEKVVHMTFKSLFFRIKIKAAERKKKTNAVEISDKKNSKNIIKREKMQKNTCKN